ncbi:MAG TPA: hypothetical protein VMW38_16735 [Terriglobia bacterium]|nr:hypothetical protein [Terriglobia bacterium]
MTKVCDHFRLQLAKALVDDLVGEEREALQDHLAECPACSLDQELYATTVRQLRSTADVPVPRHFFVYPKTIRLTPWQLFRQLNFAWRATLVATAVLLLVGASLLVGNARFKAENGSFSLSFGKPPLPRPTGMTTGEETEVLKHELLMVMEEKLRQERLEFTRLIQAELKRSTALRNRQQRQLLQTALESMETRFNSQLTTAGKTLEARNDQALLSLIGAWQAQREQDLARINVSFEHMQAQGQLKERQTDNILNTLIQVAQLKLQ